MRKLFSKATKKRGRRGFSVAEVVVAIAVIVIVSASAITFIGVQTRAEAKAVASIEATNIAENAIECFRFAKKHGSGGAESHIFETFMATDCGYTLVGDGPYTVTKNGATVTISISENTIEINAFAGEKEILQTRYTYPEHTAP